MVKAVDKGMVIGEIRLMEKRGGKTEYRRTERRKDGKTEGRKDGTAERRNGGTAE
jgi:hypothetical protein